MTGPTRPLRRPPVPGRPDPGRSDRRLGITGVVAGGLAALALALVVSWVVAPRWGVPGPAPTLLLWHLGAAAAAVAAQVRADRSGRPGAALAVTAGALAVLAVLWFG